MSAANNMNNLENKPTVFEAIMAEPIAVDTITVNNELLRLSPLSGHKVPTKELSRSPSPSTFGNPARSNSSVTDCCICFESISSTTNNCTTPCGHQFCFKCIAKTLARSNACPCCRAPLQEDDENIEINDDEDEEDEEEYDDDDDEDDVEGELETVVKMFTLKGYTINDVLAMLTGRTSKIDTKYTKEYIDQLDNDLDDICNAADSIAVIAKAVKDSANERAERAMFGLEDQRI